MNYYNPYYFAPYTIPSVGTKSLFSGLFGKGITFSSIISGTQKTLNIVNQAIPVVKQVSPMIQNAKTMFKVMNEFKKVDTPVSSNKTNKDVSNNDNNNVNNEKTISNNYTNSPTFFQ